MFDRSVERDYDINYHTRAAHKAMDECLANLEALLAIKYEPFACTTALDEKWKTWKDELNAIWY